MAGKTAAVCLLLAVGVFSEKVSPVQKVIQLLDECQAKIKNDITAEQAAMGDYMLHCHKELGEKAHAVQSAEREIADLSASVQENEAIITESGEEISQLGTHVAGKERELYGATQNRKIQVEDFKAAEQEMLDAVGETERAVAQLKSGMSLAQVKNAGFDVTKVALQRLLESASIISGASKEKLQSLLQSEDASGQSDELAVSFRSSLRSQSSQPAAAAFESQSGGILETVEQMQAKAEAQLGDLRKKEMENKHAFDMLADSLNTEVAQANKKLAAASALKLACEQKLAQAQEDLGATQKTKADDERYAATVKQDSQMKAQEFEERMISAKGEQGAIAKAREILTKGVVALVQKKSAVIATSALRSSSSDDDRRLRAATRLRDLGRAYHRVGFMELATAVASDPFGKIRGLIEDMIEKLMREAAEEASHKAFCDEEMAKSTNSQKDKEMKIEKHQTRMDEASSEIAQLTAAVKRLEGEIAEIDGAQSEATALRTKENAENTKAMSDFKQSADAVMAAIGTLKEFYEGTGAALLQRKSASHAKQPDFAASKSDSASGIIGVLEVAESDFTELFAETESSENAAAASYKKLTEENKLSRAQKETDVRGKESEIKSMEVSLNHHREDHAAVSQELEAVEAYLAKLKPECTTKVQSYGERKAARQAEIEGLKDSLSILEGK